MIVSISSFGSVVGSVVSSAVVLVVEDSVSGNLLVRAGFIKKNSAGNATYWWMRSPYAGDGSYVRRVYPDGTVVNYYAIHSLGVAPACVVA